MDIEFLDNTPLGDYFNELSEKPAVESNETNPIQAKDDPQRIAKDYFQEFLMEETVRETMMINGHYDFSFKNSRSVVQKNSFNWNCIGLLLIPLSFVPITSTIVTTGIFLSSIAIIGYLYIVNAIDSELVHLRAVNSELDKKIREAIQFIKEIEIISKGYRLHRHIVPIERIEIRSKIESCIDLRTKLLQISGELLDVTTVTYIMMNKGTKESYKVENLSLENIKNSLNRMRKNRIQMYNKWMCLKLKNSILGRVQAYIEIRFHTYNVHQIHNSLCMTVKLEKEFTSKLHQTSIETPPKYPFPSIIANINQLQGYMYIFQKSAKDGVLEKVDFLKNVKNVCQNIIDDCGSLLYETASAGTENTDTPNICNTVDTLKTTFESSIEAPIEIDWTQNIQLDVEEEIFEGVHHKNDDSPSSKMKLTREERLLLKKALKVDKISPIIQLMSELHAVLENRKSIT